MDNVQYLIYSLLTIFVLNPLGMLGFMCYEMVTISMVWWVMWSSSSFERSSAVWYMMWYSFVLGFMLVGNFDLMVMTIIISMIGFSKLPVFGLHMWLPKVHVEASMTGSMVLAGIILKMGILFCSLFCSNVMLMLIGVFVAVMMMLNSDGKVVMAYSSVAHMTLCVAALGFVSFMVGLTHVIISPLMFMAIYVSYNMSGSRVMGPSFSTWIISGILLLNIGFPMIGAFLAEVYLICTLMGLFFICFVIGYLGMGVVTMKMFFCMKGNSNSEWMAWLLVLFMLY